jgi:hypothetical protein
VAVGKNIIYGTVLSYNRGKPEVRASIAAPELARVVSKRPKILNATRWIVPLVYEVPKVRDWIDLTPVSPVAS